MDIKLDVLVECLASGLLLSWIIVHANHLRKSIVAYGRARAYRTYPKPEPVVLLLVFVAAVYAFNDKMVILGWCSMLYLAYHFNCHQTSIQYRKK